KTERVHRRDCLLKEPLRLGKPDTSHRALTCFDEMRKRSTEHSGRQVVVSEGLGILTRGGARIGCEGVSGESMKLHAPRPGEPAIERLANERMAKSIALIGLFEKLRAQAVLQRVERVSFDEATRCVDPAEFEPRTKNGGRSQQPG